MPFARLAVLIDGENIRGDVADELFERVLNLGTATVRRVYGNFTNSQARTWMRAIARHGIIARQVCSAKNAADIAIASDAMELLHVNRLDGFCIVSGDHGLASLASRLRECNAVVYGFYECQTLEPVRGSYTDIFGLVSMDPATEALIDAIRSISKNDWALLSIVGSKVRSSDYKCGSLKKLIAARKKFELHPDGQRVRIAS